MAKNDTKKTANSKKGKNIPIIQNIFPEKKELFKQETIKKEEERFISTYIEGKGSSFKLLLRLYKGYYGKLLLSGIFFIIKNAAFWLTPLITARLIDLVVYPKENAMTQILLYVGLALVLYAFNTPFHYLHIKYFSFSNRSIEAGLRGAMIRKLQQLSISFHKEMESGRIQSKVMRDVEAVEALTNTLGSRIFETVLTIIITSAIILSKNYIVFLIFLVSIPFAVISAIPFRNKMRRVNSRFRKEVETTSSNVMDMVELVPITRAHSLENKEINKLTRQITNVAKSGHELDLTNALFGSISWVVMSLFQLACVVVCVILALKKQISIGDITVYSNYFSQLLAQVSAVVSLLPIITKGFESLNSIGEILNSYDVENYKNKKKITKLEGKFEFKDVFFHYNDDDRLVLKNLNLTVEPGETIALVGESGSGKSTVVNMAIGFFMPNSGNVYIDGKNMRDLDMRSMRRRIAVVPQNTILFNGTIKDNITYGKANVTKAQIDAAVEAANLKSVIEKLPDGINTDIGEHGGKLSGGQRQRISIARALIRNPEVIIFDEATSALDTVSEAEIQAAINNLAENRTTFIVAHRLSTIRNADKIAVMQNGTCVEYGTWDELMEKKGEFYRFKMAQS